MLDREGLVFKTNGYAERQLAEYQVCYTGCERKSDKSKIHFLLRKSLVKYKILIMGTSEDIIHRLCSILGDEYANSKDAGTIREEAFCYSESLGDNLESNNYYFKCCEKLLDLVYPTSTLKTEECVNFYLYALVHRLKALGYDKIKRQVLLYPLYLLKDRLLDSI